MSSSLMSEPMSGIMTCTRRRARCQRRPQSLIASSLAFPVSPSIRRRFMPSMIGKKLITLMRQTFPPFYSRAPGQALRPVSSSGGSGCAFTTTEGPRGTEARLHHNTRKLCQLFHPRLLRPRRERPRGSAAEQRDEVAPLHSITSSARPRSIGGTSRPSAFAVLRLITSSYLVGCWTGRSAGLAPLRMRSM